MKKKGKDKKVSLETVALERSAKAAVRYSSWIYQQIRPFIGKKILEIGCGIGNITKLLIQDQDRIIVATDVNSEHLSLIKQRLKNYSSQLIIKEHDIGNDDLKELKEYQSDTVICLNVLEHIPDDLKALKNMYHILIPGGKLVLLVPAWQSLYGSLDVYLHHQRRYGKKDLERKIRESGFKIVKCFYFNLFGILAWFISSKMLRKTVADTNHISLFDFFVPCFKKIEMIIPPPIGLSLICIAQKPN